MDYKQVAEDAKLLSPKEQLSLAFVMLGRLLAIARAEDMTFSADVGNMGCLTISVRKGDHTDD